MKINFLTLFFLSLLTIGCSDDDNNSEPSIPITEALLNGTWEALSDKNGPIAVPFDRNSEDNNCPNKPDAIDIINELLIAFTAEKFYNKINYTQLGLYRYDTPLFVNGMINCNSEGMSFSEGENDDSFVRNSIDAFEGDIIGSVITDRTVLLTIEIDTDNLLLEVVFDDNNIDNIEVYIVSETARTFFGRFKKRDDNVNTEEFSEFLFEQ